ncbi:probable cyclin-dependent serine/threonine-protein kinase DDB_G0292550 isoform X2 [Condylostylus longicornis]|nr:probable cyclin-dependent serine/threonine-protein kinase DDB_G0292550 isoform X2 [Condylostylus longicornis]
MDNKNKIKTPNKIQPKNKNRRSFTPNNLNNSLPSPGISPIPGNNGRALKNNNCPNTNNNNSNLKYNSYTNNTLLDDSIILSSLSPSYRADHLDDMLFTLPKKLVPHKKTVIKRTSLNNNNDSNNNKSMIPGIKSNSMNTPLFSAKSLNFLSSTPSNNNNNSIIDIDNIDDRNNLDNNISLIFNKCDNLSADSIDFSDIQLTPKTTHNNRITISSVLFELGLQKYIKNFQEKNISYNSFMNFNNSDLINYGIENESDRVHMLKLINSEMESPC